jgi:hypothetical protein
MHNSPLYIVLYIYFLFIFILFIYLFYLYFLFIYLYYIYIYINKEVNCACVGEVIARNVTRFVKKNVDSVLTKF